MVSGSSIERVYSNRMDARGADVWWVQRLLWNKLVELVRPGEVKCLHLRVSYTQLKEGCRLIARCGQAC